MSTLGPSGRSERLPTGVEGLDRILGGGLFRDSITMVSGRPGAGKTIFANQLAFAHVRAGGRVVYATLLAETHARLIAQMRSLSFFDEQAVGKDIHYLNAVESVTQGGLKGLLELARRIVRDHGASLLVLDGMVTAEALARTSDEYKRFIAELQTWVGLVGCTVILLTSNGPGGHSAPEHTMVDGIIELSSERVQMRSMRYLAVTKLRGGPFLEGIHSYLITDHGLEVYPRIETVTPPDGGAPRNERLLTGITGLDRALDGGIVAHSTTLLLGSSGAGKTVMGLQFLAEGARLGEKCLHFGFYEAPKNVIGKADNLGLDFSGHIDRGHLFIKWFRPAEVLIDAVVEMLFRIIEKHQITRLFVDGFVGFRGTHPSQRVSSVFAAVSDRLIALGVTTLISDETRELFIREVEIPTPNVSAIFHNILFLRQVEVGAQLMRLLSIMKTRDSGADRRLWQYDIGRGGITFLAPFAAHDERLLIGEAGQGSKKAPAKRAPSPLRARPKTKRARGKGR